MTGNAPLTTLEDLVSHGLIAADAAAALEPVIRRYTLRIPAGLAAPAAADPGGPIARQFVPQPDELHETPGERADPIGDEAHSPVPGLVHRYPDRVLFTIPGTCAVYCRFCFRRESVGGANAGILAPQAVETALAYIREHAGIREVVFSGGDPFVLSPRRLGEITARLADIPHVRVIRFHTRVPAAAPERITRPLIQALKRAGKPVYIALHANHAAEFTEPVRAACARLVDAGFPMVSQSVLLKGVNDTPDALEALMRAFVENRIKPYYLHHLDPAPGTAHFRVPISEGQHLVKALRGRLSGLCQPHYMLDIPGGYGKIPLGPCGAVHDAAGGWEAEDFTGKTHRIDSGGTASLEQVMRSE
ncbi:MAG: lysine-2,3-aminomutase-like protein [Methylobacteriaceae bacterium]|nr:lysine-2,3-aminomutase-like protein [Methylobacteriaceae bacterium]